jgi:hypothetical protein
MTEQDLIDALVGSGMDDDAYLRVAFAIRNLHRRVELADRVVVGVLRNQSMLPSGLITDALDYVAITAVDVPSAA